MTYHIISGAHVALQRTARSRLPARRVLQGAVVAQFRRLVVVNLQQELAIGIHWRWHVVPIVSAPAASEATPSSTRLLPLLHIIIAVVSR